MLHREETLPARSNVRPSRTREGDEIAWQDNPETARPKRIVLTSVSSDSHTWNLVMIQLVLESMGHQVTNLGACTPDEEVVDACKRHLPDLLVVSSVNGHGCLDGERLIGQLRRDPALSRLPAVIGGKLGVRGVDDHDTLSSRLLQAGFDAVFQASALGMFQEFVDRVSASTPLPRIEQVSA